LVKCAWNLNRLANLFEEVKENRQEEKLLKSFELASKQRDQLRTTSKHK